MTSTRKAEVINEHGAYGQTIVAAAWKHGIPAALLAAVVEQESGFRNIYGSDPVRPPQLSTRGNYAKPKRVTKANYAVYKRLRKLGFGMQGVGPMQLTWYEYQDVADVRGGCWDVTANIYTGASILARLIKEQDSIWYGLRKYNGTGEAAERYADQVVDRYRKWQRRFGER